VLIEWFSQPNNDICFSPADDATVLAYYFKRDPNGYMLVNTFRELQKHIPYDLLTECLNKLRQDNPWYQEVYHGLKVKEFLEKRTPMSPQQRRDTLIRLLAYLIAINDKTFANINIVHLIGELMGQPPANYTALTLFNLNPERYITILNEVISKQNALNFICNRVTEFWRSCKVDEVRYLALLAWLTNLQNSTDIGPPNNVTILTWLKNFNTAVNNIRQKSWFRHKKAIFVGIVLITPTLFTSGGLLFILILAPALAYFMLMSTISFGIVGLITGLIIASITYHVINKKSSHTSIMKTLRVTAQKVPQNIPHETPPLIGVPPQNTHLPPLDDRRNLQPPTNTSSKLTKSLEPDAT